MGLDAAYLLSSKIAKYLSHSENFTKPKISKMI